MDGTGVKAIAELQRQIGQTVEVGGKMFSSIDLVEVKPEDPKDTAIAFEAPPVLVVSTLTGLLDYLTANPDGISNGANFGRVRQYQQERPTGARIIQIVSPTRVDVLSAYQEDDSNSRFCFVSARIDERKPLLNTYLDRETFHVNLQTSYANKGDRETVLATIGNLSSEQKIENRDDGTTQTVLARVGVVTNARVPIVNPVALAPYRSFPEIDPPLSPFILRIQEGNKCALFESAAGTWAVETASLIQKYIKVALTETVAANLLVLR